jgi:hypothetical protein
MVSARGAGTTFTAHPDVLVLAIIAAMHALKWSATPRDLRPGDRH